MSQNQNGHLTTEQLSAFLDKQLSPQESAQSEAHLRTCQQCQGTLNDLRKTVALLHALPQPALPRSFVLSPETLSSATQEPATPVTIQLEERRRQRQQRQPGPRPPERSQVRRSGMPRALRVMNTLVALVGFIFLVSAIPFLNGGAAGSSSSGTSQPTVTPSPTFRPNTNAKPKLHGTSTVTPTPTPASSTASGQNTAQNTNIFDPGAQGERAIVGLILLMLALLIWLLARWRRVRQT